MYLITLASIFLALATGLANLRFAKSVVFTTLTAILLVTFCTEAIVSYLTFFRGIYRYNNIIYNSFSFIDITLWFFIFSKILKDNVTKYILPLLYLAIMSYSLYELYYIPNWKFLHTGSERIYSLAVLGMSVFYLNSTLKLEYHNLLTDPYFYICTGCIFYHSILFGNMYILEYGKNIYLKEAGIIFSFLQEIANCLYYLSLCSAFIICYYNQRRSPSYTPGLSLPTEF